MIINTTRENIQHALNEANKTFEGNLQFNAMERLSDTRYRVTLRVKDSHGLGARLGYPGLHGKQRHLINACWHAHGVFFDNLPEGTKIHTGTLTTHAGDDWKDQNVGSQFNPLYMSEACECAENGLTFARGR